MNSSHSTQQQRDALTSYLRSYNVNHRMLSDGYMEIKLYSKFDNQKKTMRHLVFIDPDGGLAYGEQPA